MVSTSSTSTIVDVTGLLLQEIINNSSYADDYFLPQLPCPKRAAPWAVPHAESTREDSWIWLLCWAQQVDQQHGLGQDQSGSILFWLIHGLTPSFRTHTVPLCVPLINGSTSRSSSVLDAPTFKMGWRLHSWASWLLFVQCVPSHRSTFWRDGRKLLKGKSTWCRYRTQFIINHSSFRFLYWLFLAIDACFRIKCWLVSSEKQDPGLGMGWLYFVEDEPYCKYLLTVTDQKEISSCTGLSALDHTNSKSNIGLATPGAGIGCWCIMS